MLARHRAAGVLTAGVCLLTACVCVSLLSGGRSGRVSWGEGEVALGGVGTLVERDPGAGGKEVAKSEAWADAEASKLVDGLDHVAVTHGETARAARPSALLPLQERLEASALASPSGLPAGPARLIPAKPSVRSLPVAKVVYTAPATEPAEQAHEVEANAWPLPLKEAAARVAAQSVSSALVQPTAAHVVTTQEGAGLVWPNKVVVADGSGAADKAAGDNSPLSWPTPGENEAQLSQASSPVAPPRVAPAAPAGPAHGSLPAVSIVAPSEAGGAVVAEMAATGSGRGARAPARAGTKLTIPPRVSKAVGDQPDVPLVEPLQPLEQDDWGDEAVQVARPSEVEPEPPGAQKGALPDVDTGFRGLPTDAEAAPAAAPAAEPAQAEEPAPAAPAPHPPKSPPNAAARPRPRQQPAAAAAGWAPGKARPGGLDPAGQPQPTEPDRASRPDRGAGGRHPIAGPAPRAAAH